MDFRVEEMNSERGDEVVCGVGVQRQSLRTQYFLPCGGHCGKCGVSIIAVLQYMHCFNGLHIFHDVQGHSGKCAL